MSIAVTCQCRRRIRVKAEFTGRSITCPFCGQPVEVRQELVDVPPALAPPRGPASSLSETRDAAAAPPHSRRASRRRARRRADATVINALSLTAALLGVTAGLVSSSGQPGWGGIVGGFGLVPASVGILGAAVSARGLLTAPLVAWLFCGTMIAVSWTIVVTPSPAELVATPDVGAESSTAVAPSVATRWYSPSEPARQGDFLVSIRSIEVTQPMVRDMFFSKATRWKERGLVIAVEFKNQGQTHWVQYRNVRARVTDNLGRRYRELDLELSNLVGRELDDQKLRPGKALVDLFVFEPPDPAATSLAFEIPGESVGHREPFRFRIPLPLPVEPAASR